uniref:Hypotheticial protein n=1 Tax=Schistosoma japonicum TaxID=6182 RepID=C1LE00_SCHJA|nr:hypotheticial protein [Schistosoma japonicum]
MLWQGLPARNQLIVKLTWLVYVQILDEFRRQK